MLQNPGSWGHLPKEARLPRQCLCTCNSGNNSTEFGTEVQCSDAKAPSDWHTGGYTFRLAPATAIGSVRSTSLLCIEIKSCATPPFRSRENSRVIFIRTCHGGYSIPEPRLEWQNAYTAKCNYIQVADQAARSNASRRPDYLHAFLWLLIMNPINVDTYASPWESWFASRHPGTDQAGLAGYQWSQIPRVLCTHSTDPLPPSPWKRTDSGPRQSVTTHHCLSLLATSISPALALGSAHRGYAR